MGIPVASNPLVDALAIDVQAIVGAVSARLRLFTNNFTPAPVNLIGDFTEATFNGYAQINLNGLYGTPFKVVNGIYETDGPICTFTGAAGANQVVYGWYIVSGATLEVAFSRRFDAPITVLPGVVFTVQVNLTVTAESIL